MATYQGLTRFGVLMDLSAILRPSSKEESDFSQLLFGLFLNHRNFKLPLQLSLWPSQRNSWSGRGCAGFAIRFISEDT